MAVMEITVPTIPSDSANAAITFFLINLHHLSNQFYYNPKICINCVHIKYFNKIQHKIGYYFQNIIEFRIDIVYNIH